MRKIRLTLFIFLLAAICQSTFAQPFTYHYVVKDLGLKSGDMMPEVFLPKECNDLIQFSYMVNSADAPYFDGENAVCPASNDGGPKGSGFYMSLNDLKGIYVIKDLKVVMANNSKTTIQCDLTNDSKWQSTKETCPEAYEWTNQKIQYLTLMNNGPEPFYIKEIILTVDFYTQSDTCELHIPYVEKFERPVLFQETTSPSTCWNMYQNCSKSALPKVVGLTTGASYVYDGYYQLDMRETSNCWNMAVLPAVKDEAKVKDLIMDFYAEAISSTAELEVGVLEDPNDPASFVRVEMISGETLLKTWHHVIVPFNKYTGSGSRIAIKNSNAVGGVHIDNLTVNRISAAPAPFYVTAANSDYKKIKVDWSDVNPTDKWEVELVEKGAKPGTGKSYVVNAHPAILDVEANHYYDVYVKAYYNAGTSENSEPTSIYTSSCPESEMCTYTIEWAGDGLAGALNNMIRVFINGNLADYSYMPYGKGPHNTYINLCKGDELRLAFKRGTNYKKYTNFLIVDPDGEVIGVALNGILSGDKCEMGDLLLYTDYDNPFLTLTANCSNCKAPTKLAASNITYTSAEISWVASAPADSWIIEYGEPGFQIGQGEKVEASVSPFTLENLTPGTDYELYIYSRCGEELSRKSSALLFSTLAECNSPVKLTAKTVSATFATLTWEAGDGETAWEVRYLGPNETEYSEPVKVTEPTITVENLMNESEYIFNVRAICNEGKYSKWVKISVKTTPCKQPSNIRITDISHNSALVSWDALNQEKKWMVSYKDKEASKWTMNIVTENPYMLQNLKASTIYSVHIQAFCSEDVMSDPSMDAAFTTKADGIEDYSFNPVVLYPSYADNTINVYINDAQVQASNIEIYDMQGKLLKRLDAQGNNTQISVGQLSAGLYMVRVHCDKGNFVRKFIKK